jgi:ABC-2 type transport system permease protein
MNTANTMSGLPNEHKSVAPAATMPTRPFYWSLRRELWENRSIYLAPLIVAVVVFVGFLFSTRGMPARRQAVLLLDPIKQRAIIGAPYDFAATALLFTAFIVGFFYCLDALYGERRDRSLLFWKSLPVSDFTTVLSKAIVPLAIIPVITFVTVIATQFLMLLASSGILLTSGLAGTTWTRFDLIQQSIILLYALVALLLWHAPIYGYLLFVSSVAPRATFLCAVLPAIVIGIFEKITFNTSHFASMIGSRLIEGVATRAFSINFHSHDSITSLAQLTPGRFLSTPGLWIGLAVAAIFLGGAIRFRRYQGPL